MKFCFTLRLTTICALLTISFIGFSSQAFSQKFVFNPSKNITAKWTGLEKIHVDVDIDNKTTGDLKLSWVMIENTIPLNWLFSLCDNQNCYSASVIPPGGSDFASIGKGEYAFFKLLFDSSGAFTEVTTVKIVVFETGKKNLGTDTVTFTILPKSLGLTEETTKFSSILPNPATDIVRLSAFNAITTVEVFTTLGVKVMEIDNNSMEVSLDVHSLPVGVYFVKARDIYGKINTAIFHKL